MATAFGPKKMPSTYKGKSTQMGHGGRAAKMMDEMEGKGMDEDEAGAVVGKIARSKNAAPGQKYYHPTRKKK